MVNKIKIQRIIISTNAAPGFCNPKNNIDQIILSKSWTKNIVIPVFTFFILKPFFHTRKKANPIKKKSNVQTGANTEDGGTQLGFTISAYQVGILGIVKIEPISPVPSAIMIDTRNLKVLLNFIF
jgi:hypothetical protein